MKLGEKFLGSALLCLFVLSGFAGLIYQSMWSQYLGLILGHAAYAQTLVLAIFMGGMAIGAGITARITQRLSNPIRAYAWIEIAIGVAGVCFHPIFLWSVGLSNDSILPMLSANWVSAFQWSTSTLLILPQSILLGATFPLISAGYLRMTSAGNGEVLGGLYFSNSIGAAFGALFATFALLPSWGLPGGVTTAGVINIAVGAAVLLLFRSGPSTESQLARRPDPSGSDSRSIPQRTTRLLLAAAAITGATSFVYEVTWTRMLNQALGTTLHSFELMLSAFILGLALGGLWVRRHSSATTDAIRYAGFAQVFMGIAAFVSAISFAFSFEWTAWMMRGLARSSEGYSLFSLGTIAISMAVMLPAAFFAGMTLPLLTMAQLSSGADESAIGKTYSWNTVGALLGVFGAVHVLVPVIGLHLSLVTAGALDVALGLVLLRQQLRSHYDWSTSVAAIVAGTALAFAMLFGRPDPLAQVSGVFRTGSAQSAPNTEVIFLADGKTSTISWSTNRTSASIATNGKPDASLSLSVGSLHSGDEITMVMAGALPMALSPTARDVAIVGWGSGLTTHTVLGNPAIRRVDTIEIEKTMHEAARLFGARVERAYSDPRSHVQIEDARTWFAKQPGQFDIIISEPSNPWVSGVANLFTQEFYRIIRPHLADGGVFVQWVQGYELSDELLAQMIAAMLTTFPDTSAYVTNSSDILLVSQPRAIAASARLESIQGEALKQEMSRVGLSTSDDFALRKIGSRRALEIFVSIYESTAHSDYFPVVALNAPRERYLRSFADTLLLLNSFGLPLLDFIDSRTPLPMGSVFNADPYSAPALQRRTAIAVTLSLNAGTVVPELDALAAQTAGDVAHLMELSSRPVDPLQESVWLQTIAKVAQAGIGPLPAADLQDAWVAPKWLDEGQPELLVKVFAAYSATAQRNATAMYANALAVLGDDRLLSKLPAISFDHLMLIAALGAIGDHNCAAVTELEQGIGGRMRGTEQGFRLRRFLLAAAQHPGVCGSKVSNY